MTINNKSERNYRSKCLGWPVTSYGGVCIVVVVTAFKMAEGQTGAFDVDIVDAAGTTNLE